jgi:cyclopropane-fatty-acyl-phospholipid synthase
MESIGAHYALTLAAWRARFLQNLAAVRRLGFDDRFLRMWDFYLAWCEGSFRERYINDVQLLLAKNGTQRPLIGDPCFEDAAVSSAVRGA